MIFDISIKRIIALTKKEIAVLRRDTVAMIIMFLLPIALIIIVSVGQEIRIIENPIIAVLDKDESEGIRDLDASEALVDVFRKYDVNNEIDLILSMKTESEAYENMLRGRITGYLVIPNGMEYNLSIHFPVVLRVKIDSNGGLFIQNTQKVLSDLFNDYREEYGFKGVFRPSWNYVNRPERASLLFNIAPFFYPWTLFSLAMIVSVQAIVSDIPKDRMKLTPASKFEIIVSKYIGMEILMIILSCIMVFESSLFGFEGKSGLLMAIFVLAFTASSGVTIGLMLSALAETPLAALQFFIFFFLIQAIVMFFIPWEDFQTIFPVYNGQALMQNVIIRGESLWGENLYYVQNILLFTIITFVGATIIYYLRKSVL